MIVWFSAMLASRILSTTKLRTLFYGEVFEGSCQVVCVFPPSFELISCFSAFLLAPSSVSVTPLNISWDFPGEYFRPKVC